jgi:hypothetical protein
MHQFGRYRSYSGHPAWAGTPPERGALAKWVVLQFTLGVFLYVGFPLSLDAANPPKAGLIRATRAAGEKEAI